MKQKCGNKLYYAPDDKLAEFDLALNKKRTLFKLKDTKYIKDFLF